MALFAGLASLAALSLFFAHFLRRSSALMPLLAIACTMLFFTAAGIFDVLAIGGWLWYALCAAALVFTLIRTKGRFFKLFSPGLVFFIVGGAGFILLFLITRPMLTQWDEFTFWGTAAKVVSEQNQLYTLARSSLIARSYPPGLIVYSYMMQFFGGFTEAGFIACFAVLYLAAFAAATALWGKNKTATVLYLGALLLLPFFFETNWPAGQMMWSYLSCMADMPMAFFFGGALCFWFAGGERGGRAMLPFLIILAALVCIKDMGLALALIALVVAALDLVFCERDRVAFFRLRRWWAILVFFVAGLALIAGAYVAWAAHLSSPRVGINRFDLGTQSQSLPMLDMLLAGFGALFGLAPSAQFSDVLPKMLKAFFTRQVTLIGSGVVVLAIILVISFLAWLLAATRRRRRRVLVFTIAMALGFAAFYVFNIFTYAFIFKGPEAEHLKDYARYISPMWIGWLMGALVLLSSAANSEKAVYSRLRAARALSGVVALAFVAVVALRSNWNGNFLRISPSLYTQRASVQQVAGIARGEGLKPEHDVYILSQFDDGTRFYLFGFELEAVRVPVYYGPRLDENGAVMLDANGQTLYAGNAAAELVATPGGGSQVACTREELAAYLEQAGCTHVLLDVIDNYILEEFAPLFADGLQGWTDDETLGRGHRYYRVARDEAGALLLVPEEGGGAP